jgi:xanthine dehydrogenase YagS FAD-binding subunit
MREFEYTRATDAATALAEAGKGATFLAGGTNLVDLMKLGVETPGHLVDVRRLPGSIADTADGGLRIDASVPNSVVAADPRVRERYPFVARALLSGASGQLRNLATTGGNLMQRTRCVYFMDATKPCNKREPGTGCPAREGDHANLAILGWSDACVATHPSDFAVPLVALDALVHVQSANGGRVVALEELHRLPGVEPHRDTVLEPGELITAVELPPLPFATRSAYRKVRERASFSFAIVSVAAALDVVDGVVREARLALGGVAHKPWRCRAAEAVLLGRPATAETFARAADEELADARPLRDNGHKVPIARNTICTVLADLAARP